MVATIVGWSNSTMVNVAGETINLAPGSRVSLLEVIRILQDVLGSLAQISDVGIQINPDAVTIARGFFEGLRRAVVEARRLREALTLDDLREAAAGVGAAIGFVAEVLGAALQGHLEPPAAADAGQLDVGLTVTLQAQPPSRSSSSKQSHRSSPQLIVAAPVTGPSVRIHRGHVARGSTQPATRLHP